MPNFKKEYDIFNPNGPINPNLLVKFLIYDEENKIKIEEKEDVITI
jgi:hypothetical protein